MIGVISSTIYPSDDPMYWGSPRNSIPYDERLEQTRQTIVSLVRTGVSEIILADNSGENWITGTEEFLKPAKVYVLNQYQFKNKGISEIYLLLSVLKVVPEDVPILKISGRYYLTEAFSNSLGENDIVAKIARNDSKNLYMSTRCYLVKNKNVHEAFLRSVLRDLYGYGARIVGPRSLYRILLHSLRPSKEDYVYEDPSQAIEVPAARVLRNGPFKVRLVDKLGIEGVSGDLLRRLIVE